MAFHLDLHCQSTHLGVTSIQKVKVCTEDFLVAVITALYSSHSINLENYEFLCPGYDVKLHPPPLG